MVVLTIGTVISGFSTAVSAVKTAFDLYTRYEIRNENRQNCELIHTLLMNVESEPIEESSATYKIVAEQLTPLIKQTSDLFSELKETSTKAQVEQFCFQKGNTRMLENLRQNLQITIGAMNNKLIRAIQHQQKEAFDTIMEQLSIIESKGLESVAPAVKNIETHLGHICKGFDTIDKKLEVLDDVFKAVKEIVQDPEAVAEVVRKERTNMDFKADQDSLKVQYGIKEMEPVTPALMKAICSDERISKEVIEEFFIEAGASRDDIRAKESAVKDFRAALLEVAIAQFCQEPVKLRRDFTDDGNALYHLKRNYVNDEEKKKEVQAIQEHFDSPGHKDKQPVTKPGTDITRTLMTAICYDESISIEVIEKFFIKAGVSEDDIKRYQSMGGNFRAALYEVAKENFVYQKQVKRCDLSGEGKALDKLKRIYKDDEVKLKEVEAIEKHFNSTTKLDILEQDVQKQ